MGADSAEFLKRALLLQAKLQDKQYPNATTLASLCGCSRSTAMRTIDRLRYEFGVPIAYSETRRGYYLTKEDFSFNLLPPTKDSIVVLIIMSELMRLIDSPTLKLTLDTLWAQATNGRADVTYDLEAIKDRFSCQSTSVACFADLDLVGLLNYCHTGETVEVLYDSPWKTTEMRCHQGVFERLHWSDGILYGLFIRLDGRELVFNLSFIKSVKPILVKGFTAKKAIKRRDSFWLEGFGVWGGSKPVDVEIGIAPEAAQYYAAQTWHPAQQDTWQDQILVRKFPCIPSPELARRILSLGRHIMFIKPDKVVELLKPDLVKMMSCCGISS